MVRGARSAKYNRPRAGDLQRYSLWQLKCPNCKSRMFIPTALKHRIVNQCERWTFECVQCHIEFKPLLKVSQCKNCNNRVDCLTVPAVRVKLVLDVRVWLKLIIKGVLGG